MRPSSTRLAVSSVCTSVPYERNQTGVEKSKLPWTFSAVEVTGEVTGMATFSSNFKRSRSPRTSKMMLISHNHGLYGDLIYCQRLKRSAAGRTAAYHVGTRRSHPSLSVAFECVENVCVRSNACITQSLRSLRSGPYGQCTRSPQNPGTCGCFFFRGIAEMFILRMLKTMWSLHGQARLLYAVATDRRDRTSGQIRSARTASTVSYGHLLRSLRWAWPYEIFAH